MEPLVYMYDPKAAADEPFFQPGATKGYLVLHDGTDAMVADCVVLADGEGQVWMEPPTLEFRPARIVDDH